MGLLTFNKDELAIEIEMERTTLNRLITSHPVRLPPFVNLGTEKRIKPVWLKDTVHEWLKQREGSVVMSTPAASVVKPRRGRPRNGAAVVGGI